MNGGLGSSVSTLAARVGGLKIGAMVYSRISSLHRDTWIRLAYLDPIIYALGALYSKYSTGSWTEKLGI